MFGLMLAAFPQAFVSPDPVPEREKPQADSQVQARAHQQDQHDRAPDHIADLLQKTIQCFHRHLRMFTIPAPARGPASFPQRTPPHTFYGIVRWYTGKKKRGKRFLLLSVRSMAPGSRASGLSYHKACTQKSFTACIKEAGRGEVAEYGAAQRQPQQRGILSFDGIRRV